ncbi:hypothetical protein ACFSR7_05955 [Cohnella sp. GCM10020058]|uniref:hypothetical protein n=1 Tax=Cohnella sp. GCM10020058 TaxID=3317330 RepID=UPI00362DFADA
MNSSLDRSDFWSHGSAMQAFVRIIKENPQLHLDEAEIETPLYKQVINGDICADQYNSCVALVGVVEGDYRKSWRPGATVEFDKALFDRIPFTYELDVASRTITIDDIPDRTGLFLMLVSKEITIRLRFSFLHQIVEEVVSWIAAFPTEVIPAQGRRRSAWNSVNEVFETIQNVLANKHS